MNGGGGGNHIGLPNRPQFHFRVTGCRLQHALLYLSQVPAAAHVGKSLSARVFKSFLWRDEPELTTLCVKGGEESSPVRNKPRGLS